VDIAVNGQDDNEDAAMELNAAKASNDHPLVGEMARSCSAADEFDSKESLA